MFKEQMIKVKDKFLKQTEGNNKKKIENLVVFVIILIITIIIINTIWNNDDKENDAGNTQKVLAKNTNTINENNTNLNYETTSLEKKLENILGKINGVGEVNVLITYYESSQTIAMYNEDTSQNDTQETDTNGGNRKISETSTKKEVIYQEINGEKIPVTQSIIMPKIEGAIVIAKGAQNIDVKTNIIQAVEAATGLSTHKIQVFEMQ